MSEIIYSCGCYYELYINICHELVTAHIKLCQKHEKEVNEE